MNKNVVEFIIKNRFKILTFVLIVSLISLYKLKDLKVNPDVIKYLPKKDTSIIKFERIGELYNSNYFIIIGYRCENVFDNDVLKEIDEITKKIEDIKGIAGVTSLTNIIDIKLVDSVITIEPLIDTDLIPFDNEFLDSLKKYATNKKIYKNRIVSEDGKSTLIIVRYESDFSINISNVSNKDSIVDYYKNYYIEPYFEIEYSKNEINISINKTLLTSYLKENIKTNHGELYFGGIPSIVLELTKIIKTDALYLGILAIIIILASLLIIFKHKQAIIFTILNVLLSILWTFGLMSFFNIELNILTNIIPVILIAVGSAYTIHVINKIRELYFATYNFYNSIIEAMKYLIKPLFFSAITTMVGFLAFIAGSYLVIIKLFGLFSAIGIFISFANAYFLTPIYFYLFPLKLDASKIQAIKKKSKVNKILHKNFFFVKKYNKQILFTTLILVVIFAFAVPHIERSSSIIDYFKSNSEVKKGDNFLTKNFGGSIYFFVNISGDVLDLKNLLWLDSLQQKIDNLKSVSYTFSIVNLFKEMNYVMGEGEVLPNSQEKINNLWFLIDGQKITEQVITSDLQNTCLQVVLNTTESKIMNELLNFTNDYLEKHKTTNINVFYAGYPEIYTKLDNSIVKSQILSLIIAILFMFFVFITILKNFTISMYSLTPLVITILALFGIMSIFKISLNVATVLVASILLGIGIDYSIHFLSYLQYELKQNKDFNEALYNSITISGKAIVINVISVSLGFSVLIFSQLVPIIYFGILLSITMIVSGISALVILPVILEKFNKKL